MITFLEAGSWWRRNKPIIQLRLIISALIIFGVIPWVIGVVACLLFIINAII